MNEETKLAWLKRVLMIKIVVVVLLWGLPTWIAPESILNLLGESLPDPPFYMRIFGATQMGAAILFWFAYKNPVGNRDIIRYAAIETAIAFMTMIFLIVRTPITNPTVWISAALELFFSVSFFVLTPKKS